MFADDTLKRGDSLLEALRTLNLGCFLLQYLRKVWLSFLVSVLLTVYAVLYRAYLHTASGAHATSSRRCVPLWSFAFPAGRSGDAEAISARGKESHNACHIPVRAVDFVSGPFTYGPQGGDNVFAKPYPGVVQKHGEGSVKVGERDVHGRWCACERDVEQCDSSILVGHKQRWCLFANKSYATQCYAENIKC